jgi:hypothetical protein
MSYKSIAAHEHSKPATSAQPQHWMPTAFAAEQSYVLCRCHTAQFVPDASWCSCDCTLPFALQDAPLDSDREADAARLDDAEATGDGISDQDFTRGKRFRKLHRVLVSTAVSRHLNASCSCRS